MNVRVWPISTFVALQDHAQGWLHARNAQMRLELA
jgi:hypothetical protein